MVPAECRSSSSKQIFNIYFFCKVVTKKEIFFELEQVVYETTKILL